MKKNILWLLFKECFLLSTFTFGGGYVIIALMKKKFVDELHLLEEDEILDITTIAQSAPGAVAVNASLLVGYKIKGVTGAIITTLATILPPMILLTLISYVYEAFISNALIANILDAMAAVVAAVILDTVINMIIGVAKGKNVPQYLTFVLALLLVFIIDLEIIYLIGIGILLGLIYTLFQTKGGKR